MVHLIDFIGLFDEIVWLGRSSGVVGQTSLWHRSVLFRVIWMIYHCGSIRVVQTSLDILPQVMEVHDLIVLKLVFVEAHLLVVNLFEALGPFIWLGQKLQALETLRQVAVFIKSTRFCKGLIRLNLLAKLVDLITTPVRLGDEGQAVGAGSSGSLKLCLCEQVVLLGSICVILLFFKLPDDLEDLVEFLKVLIGIMMQKLLNSTKKCAHKATYLVIFESVAFFSSLQFMYFLSRKEKGLVFNKLQS